MRPARLSGLDGRGGMTSHPPTVGTYFCECSNAAAKCDSATWSANSWDRPPLPKGPPPGWAPTVGEAASLFVPHDLPQSSTPSPPHVFEPPRLEALSQASRPEPPNAVELRVGLPVVAKFHGSWHLATIRTVWPGSRIVEVLWEEEISRSNVFIEDVFARLPVVAPPAPQLVARSAASEQCEGERACASTAVAPVVRDF